MCGAVDSVCGDVEWRPCSSRRAIFSGPLCALLLAITYFYCCCVCVCVLRCSFNLILKHVGLKLKFYYY